MWACVCSCVFVCVCVSACDCGALWPRAPSGQVATRATPPPSIENWLRELLATRACHSGRVPRAVCLSHWTQELGEGSADSGVGWKAISGLPGFIWRDLLFPSSVLTWEGDVQVSSPQNKVGSWSDCCTLMPFMCQLRGQLLLERAPETLVCCPSSGPSCPLNARVLRIPM